MASTNISDVQEHRRAVTEDVIWMTDCGEHPDNIVRRLHESGYHYSSAESLARVLDKWHEHSLARRLSGVAA